MCNDKVIQSLGVATLKSKEVYDSFVRGSRVKFSSANHHDLLGLWRRPSYFSSYICFTSSFYSVLINLLQFCYIIQTSLKRCKKMASQLVHLVDL